jgi:hypothetical protein
MLSSDDVFFGASAPEGYKPADEAAIASILATLRETLIPTVRGLETLEGALALETLASQIRIKIAKGGTDAG